jgi:hypothetical protein
MTFTERVDRVRTLTPDRKVGRFEGLDSTAGSADLWSRVGGLGFMAYLAGKNCFMVCDERRGNAYGDL